MTKSRFTPRSRPLALVARLRLAETASTAHKLRQPPQPIVFVAPQSSTDETTALKQRVAELEDQLATAQAAAVARLQREERVAAITFAEVDNRAAYAAKTARHTAPAKVVITTAHVDVR